MRRTLCLALLLSFGANVAPAQDAKDAKPAPAPQQQEKSDPAEDVVYKEGEVDVKARPRVGSKLVVTTDPASAIRFTPDCPARGAATLALVINRSGKVAAVTLVKPSGCRVFDARSVKETWKVKFTPAQKDGRPVSQEMTAVTRYEWPGGKR